MSESADTHSSSSSSSSTSGWAPGRDLRKPASSGQSLIGPTVVIKGEVSAEEDLMVMGRIEGFIDHSQTVTIHADGTVAAEVKAQEVLVEGTVDGNVYGTKRVEIAETGRVNGNVYAPRVGVLEGASFKGAIDMDSDVEAIERRFREKTGIESKTAKPKSSNASNESTGETNAAQTEEKGSEKDSGSNAGESASGNSSKDS